MPRAKLRVSPEDRLAYPYPEAGDILGVSESTIRRMVAAGDINAVRVGGSVRITRAEIMRILADAEAVAGQ